ncbi:caib baif family enzyme [Diplodia corticola]|uniref:Caib baif family enzyme n=1 Tax=Diplodia corticola TaxID=236234 RepID=A0A1J9QPN1_9PEZI|nr:caib baif family enzyme [Diplodia corticola]OJD30416.1 caib baif family enzyme [Diplodia corticola]
MGDAYSNNNNDDDDNYSVQAEAARILHERLLNDASLGLPPSFAEAARKIRIVGDDPKPFVPTPCKMTESSTALTALVAAAASAVAADRYGIDYQDVEVNSDLATLFLESVLLPTTQSASQPSPQSYLAHPQLQREFAKGDHYATSKPIHQEATNVYRTRDGRWYHLHGSMNAAATMRMVGVAEQDVTRDEAIAVYAAAVGSRDAAELEALANGPDYRQAGVTCLRPDEFFASDQGRVMGAEPLWTRRDVPAPAPTPWPEAPSPSNHGFKPLAGIRVIDFSRVIAAPVISKLLAVLGADVIKVTNENLPDLSILWMDLSTGKRDANVDLKSAAGREQFARLVAGADVLVDGYRPGVLERLGFDAARLRELNPALVYARENCYGFKGPLAHRSGWQQISDCLVGISWLQGEFLGLDEPVVPLLPNSDYQTGLVGAAAILHALLARTKAAATSDIDVSLTQYNIWYYRLGQYGPTQRAALLARNEGFRVRHYDEMQTLLFKSHDAIKKARPDLFRHPDFFWSMSGKEWGIDEDVNILAPAFKFEKSELGYAVPSGSRGRSKPEW